MKYVEFFDFDGNKMTVSHSSLATQDAYRVYIEEPGKKYETEKELREKPCLHLTRRQAQILIEALEDLMCDE